MSSKTLGIPNTIWIWGLGISLLTVVFAVSQQIEAVDNAYRKVFLHSMLDFTKDNAKWFAIVYGVLVGIFFGARFINNRQTKKKSKMAQNDTFQAAQRLATQETVSRMIPQAVTAEGNIDSGVMKSIQSKCEKYLTPGQCAAITKKVRDLAAEKREEIQQALLSRASGGD